MRNEVLLLKPYFWRLKRPERSDLNASLRCFLKLQFWAVTLKSMTEKNWKGEEAAAGADAGADKKDG